MNIKVYKEYRFAFGKLVATDTGKEYTFSISRNDRFYHNMEKHITKEKVESLSYANIDDIYIEDKDRFYQRISFPGRAECRTIQGNRYRKYTKQKRNSHRQTVWFRWARYRKNAGRQD